MKPIFGDWATFGHTRVTVMIDFFSLDNDV